MKKEAIELGSAPIDEECAQVGCDNYYELMRKQTRAYIKQLHRLLATQEYDITNLNLRVKSFSHDFGTYHEVVAEYPVEHPISDEGSSPAEDAAFWLEANLPTNWDEDARRELGETLT